MHVTLTGPCAWEMLMLMQMVWHTGLSTTRAARTPATTEAPCTATRGAALIAIGTAKRKANIRWQEKEPTGLDP